MTKQFTEDVEIQGNLLVGDDPGPTNALVEAQRDATSTAKPKRGVQTTGAIADENAPTGTLTWSNHEVAVSGASTDVEQVTALRAAAQSADGTVGTLVGVEANVTPDAGVGEAVGIHVPDVTGAADNFAIKTGTGKVHLGDAIELEEIATSPTEKPGTMQLYAKTDNMLYVKDDNGNEINLINPFSGISGVCEGRLSLHSTQPVPTGNVSNMTILYFHPYKGNRIALYDGTDWQLHEFDKRNITLSGTSANTNYDVFAYWNGSAVTLELVSWSSNTLRSTGLTFQDGVYVKSGDVTRRYIGTMRTTFSDRSTDSDDTRFVFNYYNQVARRLLKQDATGTWTYSNISWRELRNQSSNRVEFVIGIETEPVILRHHFYSYPQSSNAGALPGIALDATNTNHANIVGFAQSTSGGSQAMAEYLGFTGEGYHYLQLMERTYNGNTAIILGDGFGTKMGGIGYLKG